MSREFNRVVECEFAQRMPQLGLTAEKPSGPIAWPGERCFRMDSPDSLAWICIYPNHKGLNEFYVEIAWSHRGAYPSTCNARPTSRFQFPDGFGQIEEGFVRLGDFCEPKQGAWSLGTFDQRIAILTREEAVELVTPLVESAHRTIEKVGLPCLKQAIESRATFLARST
jgi:hypothetical protein